MLNLANGAAVPGIAFSVSAPTSEVEPNNQDVDATAIVIGTPINANLDANTTDTFKFFAGPSRLVHIATFTGAGGCTTDTDIVVAGVARGNLAASVDGNGACAALDFVTPASTAASGEVFLVRVKAGALAHANDAYTLQITGGAAEREPNDTAQQANVFHGALAGTLTSTNSDFVTLALDQATTALHVTTACSSGNFTIAVDAVAAPELNNGQFVVLETLDSNGCPGLDVLRVSLDGQGQPTPFSSNVPLILTPTTSTAVNYAVLASASVCGNGRIELNETCDDGNGGSGDGCGSSCVEENSGLCHGEPSVCTLGTPLFVERVEGNVSAWAGHGSTWAAESYGSTVTLSSAASGQGWFETVASGSTTGDVEVLTSPAIDLTGVSGPVTLEFQHAVEGFAACDGAHVFAVSAGGARTLLTPAGGYPSTLAAQNPAGAVGFGAGSTSGYDPALFDLSPFVGQVIHLDFQAEFNVPFCGSSGDWLVDDVRVVAGAPAP